MLSTLKQTLSSVGRRVRASLSNGTCGELLRRGYLAGGWRGGGLVKRAADRHCQGHQVLLMLIIIIIIIIIIIKVCVNSTFTPTSRPQCSPFTNPAPVYK